MTYFLAHLVGVGSKELRMLLLNLGVRGGEAEVGGVAHAAVQLQRLLVQLVRLARGLERGSILLCTYALSLYCYLGHLAVHRVSFARKVAYFILQSLSVRVFS